MSIEATVNGEPAVVSGKQVAFLPASYELVRTEMDIVGVIDLETKKHAPLNFRPLLLSDRVVPVFDLPAGPHSRHDGMRLPGRMSLP